MDLLPGAIQPPPAVVIVDGAPGRQIVGQEAPGTAGPGEIQDGVEHLAQIDRAGPTARQGGRQERGDASPLGIGEIGRIGLTSHG